MGLVWSYDPESYASGTIVTDRVAVPERSKVKIKQEGMQWSSRSYRYLADIVISSTTFVPYF
jgi:hypothetical protein